MVNVQLETNVQKMYDVIEGAFRKTIGWKRCKQEWTEEE